MVSVCDNHSTTDARFAHRISTFYILFGGGECVWSSRLVAQRQMHPFVAITVWRVGRLTVRRVASGNTIRTQFEQYTHNRVGTGEGEVERDRGRHENGKPTCQSNVGLVLLLPMHRLTYGRVHRFSGIIQCEFFSVIFDVLNYFQKWIELGF